MCMCMLHVDVHVRCSYAASYCVCTVLAVCATSCACYTAQALEIARACRDMLGGNGIQAERHV